MAKRATSTRKVVRRPAKPAPIVEEPEVLEEEEILDEDEDEEEPEPKKPAPRARRAVAKRPAKKPEPEDEEDEDEEDEDEEEPEPKKPAPRTRRKATAKRPAKEPEPEPEPEPEEEDEFVHYTISDLDPTDVLMLVTEALDAGKSITLTKVRKKYVIASSDETVSVVHATAEPTRKSGRGRSGRVMTTAQMEEIAQTPEYREWAAYWPTLSLEEKAAEAAEAGAEWEECEDPLAHNLRISMAYRDAVGIEKWKEPCATKAARDALIYGEKTPEELGIG